LIKKIIAGSMVCLQLIIFWADYITGPLAPFSHFYIVPILISAFFLSSSWAYTQAFMASIAEILVFQQLLDTFKLTPVALDFASNGVIFFTVAFLGRHLRELLDTLAQLASEDGLTKASSEQNFL
jgi:hypothetical protein